MQRSTEAKQVAPTRSPFTTVAALRERSQRLGVIPVISRRARLQPSLGQERLWQFSKGAETSPYFNVVMAWHVRGPVDVVALELSLNRILRRHEILCSCMEESGGRPFVSLQPRAINVECVPVDGASPEERRAGALELARLELSEPFDLERDTLLKARLFRCGDSEGLLLLKTHQIVFDGSSMPLMGRELEECYSVAVKGAAPSLGEQRIQYYDVAAWQRRALMDGMFSEEEAFWGRQFEKPYTPMVLGQAKPEYRSLPGPVCRVPFKVSAPACAALNRLAAQAQTTLFTVWVTVVQRFLHALTGSRDIVLFSTIAGRHRPELRNMVGLLANVIPFRTQVSSEESFLTLVEKVDGIVSDGLVNQLLPLDQILKHVELAGRSRSGGLFQAMFIYQNAGQDGFEVAGTTFTPAEEVDNGFGRFALQLDLHPSGQEVDGWLKYRSELFDSDFGTQFVRGFCRAVEAWGTQPELPLAKGMELRAASPIGVDDLPTESGGESGKDPLERFLITTWEKILRTSPVGRCDDFFALGGDSLQALRLMSAIQKLTGHSLPLATLLRAPTVEKLAMAMRDEGSGSVVSIQTGDSRAPFFLVHSLGGSLRDLERLGLLLSPAQPLQGILIPDLAGGTPLHNTIEGIAACHIREIRRIQPEGPYYIGGNLSGGIVAFEIAQQLRKEGVEVGACILIDSTVDGYPRLAEGFPSWRRWLGNWRARLEMHFQNLAACQAGGWTGYLGSRGSETWAQARRGLSNQLRRWWSRFQPAGLRSVRGAEQGTFKTYIPQLYQGKVNLLRARHLPIGIQEDRTNGWAAYVSEGIDTVEVAGYPGTLMRGGSLTSLAEVLTHCLEAAYRRNSPLAVRGRAPAASSDEAGNEVLMHHSLPPVASARKVSPVS